jgi:hypothetical protein
MEKHKYQSPTGWQMGITGEKEPWYSNTVVSFFLVALREAIEPIFLVIEFSLLFARVEAVEAMARQPGSNFILAANADKEAHPMIYILIVFMFLGWLGYRMWRVSKGDTYEYRVLDALNKSEVRDQEMISILKDIREILTAIRSDMNEPKGEQKVG